jgi:hypothetical protein
MVIAIRGMPSKKEIPGDEVATRLETEVLSFVYGWRKMPLISGNVTQ